MCRASQNAGEGRVELKDGVNPFGHFGSSNLLAAVT